MRKIVHIDMDCFFAAVEIRDNKKIKGKPVAVGSSPKDRGVIAAASYEARAFKVHSALSSAEALRRCPDLILIKPDFDKYRQVSKEVFDIFHEYSDFVEPLSLDEAFIDLTHPKKEIKTATRAAKAIREKILVRTGLTASAGIAPNPFLAKVASDWHKPNAQFTITPDMIPTFIFNLPLRKVPGIGRVSEQKLFKMGLKTCGDLQAFKRHEMYAHFGKWGERLYELCRGRDERALCRSRQKKSISIERTFSKDINTLEECLQVLPALMKEFEKRFNKVKNLPIKNIFVKLKFADFKSTTIDDCRLKNIDILDFKKLITIAFARSKKGVRLIGIGVRFKAKKIGPIQLELWGN